MTLMTMGNGQFHFNDNNFTATTAELSISDASLGERNVIAARAHAWRIMINVPRAFSGPRWGAPCVVRGRRVGFLDDNLATE